MTTKIAINGFGRIGRAAFKAAITNKNLEVVAINDLVDNKTLAHLLKYDTVYGEYPPLVQGTKEGIKVNNKLYPVFEEKEPAKLPWGKLKVDIVLDGKSARELERRQFTVGDLKKITKKIK